MNTERNKFLTEVMGECWHELVIDESTRDWDEQLGDDVANFDCSKCTESFDESWYESRTKTWIHPSYVYNNFSTWEGFGKLITWLRKQEWYERFHVEMNGSIESWRNHLIYPDRFADAVHSYLKEREK